MGLLAFADLMKANRWEFVNNWEILLYALSLEVLILLQAGNTVSVAVLTSATVFVAVAPVLLYLFAFAIRRSNVEATQSKPKSQALEGIVHKCFAKDFFLKADASLLHQ